jgi:fucose permease
MAQMTILDATGRLLKNTGSKVFSKFKSERLSQLSAVIGMVILLFTAIIPGFNQPAGLLQISATTSAFIMALYPIFLLKLNLSLPNETKPRMFNILSVLACVIFYGVMVVLAFI